MSKLSLIDPAESTPLRSGKVLSHFLFSERHADRRQGRATTYTVRTVFGSPHAGRILGRRAASSILPKRELMIK